MAQDGRHHTCLLGDEAVRTTGHIMEPKLAAVGGEVGDQIGSLQKACGQAQMMAEIQAYWPSHHSCVPTGEENRTNPAEKCIWKVPPIHPKVAALILHGPTVEEGIGLFAQICMDVI